MAKSRKKQIDYLPQGWEWRYKEDHEAWTTSSGKTSYERHGVNTLNPNETLSVRQIQNIQRQVRANQGKPKPATVKRTGRIRTIKTEREIGENTKRGEVGTLFNPARRGITETWVFYNLTEARNYVYRYGLPEWANHAMIEIRYTERLITTNKTGSDTRDKNGYASITPFRSAYDIEYFVDKNGANGAIPNPWDLAVSNIANYDMTGDRARVYIYLAEK